jgi:hypothetical protein
MASERHIIKFIDDTVRVVEKAKLAAEPSHLKSLVSSPPVPIAGRFRWKKSWICVRITNSVAESRGARTAMRESVVAV